MSNILKNNYLNLHWNWWNKKIFKSWFKLNNPDLMCNITVTTCFHFIFQSCSSWCSPSSWQLLSTLGPHHWTAARSLMQHTGHCNTSVTCAERGGHPLGCAQVSTLIYCLLFYFLSHQVLVGADKSFEILFDVKKQSQSSGKKGRCKFWW